MKTERIIVFCVITALLACLVPATADPGSTLNILIAFILFINSWLSYFASVGLRIKCTFYFNGHDDINSKTCFTSNNRKQPCKQENIKKIHTLNFIHSLYAVNAFYLELDTHTKNKRKFKYENLFYSDVFTAVIYSTLPAFHTWRITWLLNHVVRRM